MKKTSNTFLKVIGTILGFIAFSIIILLIVEPRNPVVLTIGQEAQQKAKEIQQYSNLHLSKFNAYAISGEKVTSDCFKKYDLTMINLWTTYCGPCIEEMPAIAELYKCKPKKSNIISICVDTENNDKTLKFAREVLKDAKAEFLTLIPDASLKKALTDRVQLFPTTLFVDCHGRIVGEPHFGDRKANDYRKAILDRIALLKDVR